MMDYLARLDEIDKALTRAEQSAREQAETEELDSWDVFSFEGGHLDEWLDLRGENDDRQSTEIT